MAWQINHAWVQVQIDGSPLQAPRWVELPYQWDKWHPGQSGTAVFSLDWSRSDSSGPVEGLYLPRVGNVFAVHLNGHRLTRDHSSVPQGSDWGKLPHWVGIPSGLLAEHNRLVIEVRADQMRRAGLGVFWVGSEAQIYPTYEQASRVRVGGALAVVIFGLSVGLLSLGLWWAQWRAGSRDDMFLVAGITECLWCVRMSDPLIEHPPLPWPTWGVVVSAVYACWIAGALLFVHKATHLPSRWALRVGGAVVVGALLCAALTFSGIFPKAWSVWGGLTACLMSFYLVGFLWVSWRQPSFERAVISLAALVNVLIGLRDWYQIKVLASFDSGHAWINYSSILFGCALAVLVVQRFRGKTQEVQQLNATLARRIADKEAELQLQFTRQQGWLLEQERQQERARLLRDMHDGVGSHLGSAIRQIESGRGRMDEVLQTLQDTLDQLKLSVDALGLEPGDLAGLLASLRFRLEPRLRTAGITLDWRVQSDLPLQPHLNLKALQHLRYLLFEMVSNVLQHAHAEQLVLEAGLEDGHLVLACTDDGVGFDVQTPGGRGLRYMRERALLVGAEISLCSHASGTRVQLYWPRTTKACT
jgi:signal transduction histidine kinase